jgi:adenylate cyclase
MYIFVTGVSEERSRHPLEPGETLVGRAPNCRILLNDGSVSRAHARFLVQGESCMLQDLGSRNGTYLNGAPITQPQPVHEGDRVIFGTVAGRLEVSAEDRLTLVDGSGISAVQVLLQRPIDQEPAQIPAADVSRLMALISNLAGSLVRNQPLSNTLEDIVRLALDATRAERGFLVLKDDTTGQLVPRVARVRDGRELGRGTISRTIVSRVMDDRVALLATDTRDQAFEAVQSIAVQKIRGFVCAPLWNRDSTLGALYLDTFYSHVFQPADLELLTTLSNYAALAIEQSRLASRLLEETRHRERLGRYHSPAVVKRILEGTDAEAPFLAQERDLTVLFADIVGFTTLSERMPPQKVAALLNRYFSRMTEVIFQSEGTLDKFIGDALLAVFGAPLDQPDHAERAIVTAKAMRAALAQLNAELGGTPIQVRMAINSGNALAGDIGAPNRREYTVLGDVVNAAARIEANVAGAGQIVLTRATSDRLTSQHVLTSLGTITLRGRREPIELFVLGEDA